jgi:16S rRNA (cytosine1402-N4)-methyltransferase
MAAAASDSGARESPVHRPVMLREVITSLDLKPGQTVVDGTVGAGGHSEHILKHIGSEGTLIGLDRDPAMLEHAGRRLTEPNCRFVHASYSQLTEVLDHLGIDHVDRILLDLGLSSDQLADEQRGFGFQTSGPLDLRFDMSQGQPAWRLIETHSTEQLTRVFEEYGEERFARHIAEHLTARRCERPVRTAAELVEAVAESIPAKFQRKARKHSATRVFQALRIAVNEELTHLQRALAEALPRSLVRGGRLVVISFHSLEDRLVKQAFRDKQQWQNLTSRPVCASALEVRMNPRSRTAKLRAAERR